MILYLKKFLSSSVLALSAIAFIVTIFFVLSVFIWFFQPKGGNEYLRYESLVIDLSEQDAFGNNSLKDELIEKIQELAAAYKFRHHKFDYFENPNTRYFIQDDLRDGVIDIRESNSTQSSIHISVQWVDDKYWNFYKDVSKFVVEKGYKFSVPYTKVNGTVVSKMTKEKVMVIE